MENFHEAGWLYESGHRMPCDRLSEQALSSVLLIFRERIIKVMSGSPKSIIEIERLNSRKQHNVRSDINANLSNTMPMIYRWPVGEFTMKYEPHRVPR